ncbi:MAG: type I pullulanase [Lachnospiraceae bacterium]|nr:type I pullulanase [Lachnospiraceae bacterium]
MIIENLNNWSQLFNSKEFEKEYAYTGDDLGCTYSKDKSIFKVWSPVASAIILNIYEDGTGDNLIETFPMEKGAKGVFEVTVNKDLVGKFYTYSVTIDNLEEVDRENPDNVRYAYVENGKTFTNEVVDVYAKAVGVNGERGMIVDLANTNPVGFDSDVKPELKSFADMVIYEVHVRDFSMAKSSGMKNKGKFLAFTEHGTKNEYGESTGVDYLKELGVTHVHLLPSYDYATVDEAKPDMPQFNWGYDPKNYNVPEGSYSTNPFDGSVRIKEFKQMVQSLHKDGIRVIMDVVYNHTYSAYDSCFAGTVPNYYYRTDGMINSNGSGCGNETASDRAMFGKYLIDSVVYWAKEYHVDGFRFDLMAVHDTDTMNRLREELDKIDKSIIIYGEGWMGGPSVLPFEKACFKQNAKKVPHIAMFNDDIRDVIKGSVMDPEVAGFVNGELDTSDEKVDMLMNKMRFAVTGACGHSQVKLTDEMNGLLPRPWASSPMQSINYVSAHDNWTLWDKFMLTIKDKPVDFVMRANKMAAAIYMTAQGIPFFQAGEEIGRSKPMGDGEYDENSYKSPDSVNQIDWNKVHHNKELLDCYKALIRLRKEYKAFCMTTAKEVEDNITFIEGLGQKVMAYELKKDEEHLYVVFNGSEDAVEITLPQGTKGWKMVFETGESKVNDNVLVCDGFSCTILSDEGR